MKKITNSRTRTIFKPVVECFTIKKCPPRLSLCPCVLLNKLLTSCTYQIVRYVHMREVAWTSMILYALNSRSTKEETL